jgi:hypothetical protein
MLGLPNFSELPFDTFDADGSSNYLPAILRGEAMFSVTSFAFLVYEEIYFFSA